MTTTVILSDTSIPNFKVYRLTACASSLLFKRYGKLNSEKKIEWNNRGISTFHALFVAFSSFYLLIMSDMLHEDSYDELIVNRSSDLSDTALGISIGYFLSDLAMILWKFPVLGGLEYLDIAGFKNSKLYIGNGIALFIGWLIARIFLFIFFFAHMWIHFDEIRGMCALGFYSLIGVPPVLALMNIFWFWKITEGLFRTISKANHSN